MSILCLKISTEGQIVGARESLNGRENKARRKVKNGRRSLLFFVPYFPACLDFTSPPHSASGSRRITSIMEVLPPLSRSRASTNQTFFAGEVTIARSVNELPAAHQWTPRFPFRSAKEKRAFSNFSLWLVITIVHFVIEKKSKWMEIPTHRVTLSPGTLVGWRAELASAAVEQKVRNIDNAFLVGKWVTNTNITPVIYFALQTLNDKKFYFANLIFRKGGLSAGPSILLLSLVIFDTTAAPVLYIVGQ